MGTIFAKSEFLKVLIRLGREYKVPVLLSKPGFRAAFNVNVDTMTTDKDVVLDMIYTASPQDYKSGMQNYYTQVLKLWRLG